MVVCVEYVCVLDVSCALCLYAVQGDFLGIVLACVVGFQGARVSALHCVRCCILVVPGAQSTMPVIATVTSLLCAWLSVCGTAVASRMLSGVPGLGRVPARPK